MLIQPNYGGAAMTSDDHHAHDHDDELANRVTPIEFVKPPTHDPSPTQPAQDATPAAGLGRTLG